MDRLSDAAEPVGGEGGGDPGPRGSGDRGVLRRHRDVLATLTRSGDVHGGRLDEALRTITAAAARGLDVDRVGVWFFEDGRSTLRCAELHAAGDGARGEGPTLSREELPSYFAALEGDARLAVERVGGDARTDGLREAYAAERDVRSMLVAPVLVGARLAGVVSHEATGSARAWSLAEENLAASVADHVGLALQARDRRRAEQALRESRANYRDLVESLPLGIVVHRGREVLYANPGAADIVGLDRPEELVGRSILGFVHETSRDAAESEIRRVEEERRHSERSEYRAMRADGEVIQVEAWAIPVTYEDAPAVQTLVRDITARKRAEEGLRASEQRFRTIFEDSRDAIYITSQDGRILDVNRAACGLFGADRDELVGLDVEKLYLDPADRARFQRAIARAGSVKDWEVSLRTLDGDEMDCLLTSSVRRGAAGELLGYQGIIRDVTEQKRFEEQLQHRALHDWLTDLPNRALFRDRLQHAVSRAEREAETLAVMFLDIDRFKVINDGLGHHAGDRVLIQLGQRIRSCLREEDTVARMGGDEFAVLLENLDARGHARDAAERVAETLSEPFFVAGEEIHVSASIGISMYGAAAALPGRPKAEHLLRRADAAMYQVKAVGGTGVHVFDPDVDVAETRKLQQENELRRAVAEEAFTVHYQPIVSLETGRIVEVEPLARWPREDGSLTPPEDFIPMAEETGLITVLGAWLLERACRDLASWEAGADGDAPLRLSANLSPRQFEDPELLDVIREILDATSLPPGRLAFEVTESAVMHTPERVDQLRRMGITVTVDDFGTGYSSLHYLKNLDVDALKIDRSFVAGLSTDEQDTAIVRTIITLGRTLGLRVVGEGIETEGQLDLLRSLGCHLGQGYHLARPMEADAVAELLREDPAW